MIVPRVTKNQTLSAKEIAFILALGETSEDEVAPELPATLAPVITTPVMKVPSGKVHHRQLRGTKARLEAGLLPLARKSVGPNPKVFRAGEDREKHRQSKLRAFHERAWHDKPVRVGRKGEGFKRNRDEETKFRIANKLRVRKDKKGKYGPKKDRKYLKEFEEEPVRTDAPKKAVTQVRYNTAKSTKKRQVLRYAALKKVLKTISAGAVSIPGKWVLDQSTVDRMINERPSTRALIEKLLQIGNVELNPGPPKRLSPQEMREMTRAPLDQEVSSKLKIIRLKYQPRKLAAKVKNKARLYMEEEEKSDPVDDMGLGEFKSSGEAEECSSTTPPRRAASADECTSKATEPVVVKQPPALPPRPPPPPAPPQLYINTSDSDESSEPGESSDASEPEDEVPEAPFFYFPGQDDVVVVPPPPPGGLPLKALVEGELNERRQRGPFDDPTNRPIPLQPPIPGQKPADKKSHFAREIFESATKKQSSIRGRFEKLEFTYKGVAKHNRPLTGVHPTMEQIRVGVEAYGRKAICEDIQYNVIQMDKDYRPLTDRNMPIVDRPMEIGMAIMHVEKELTGDENPIVVLLHKLFFDCEMEQIELLFCPALVTAALRDVPNKTNKEALMANMRARLSRYCALPMPDSLAYAAAVGSEFVAVGVALHCLNASWMPGLGAPLLHPWSASASQGYQVDFTDGTERSTQWATVLVKCSGPRRLHSLWTSVRLTLLNIVVSALVTTAVSTLAPYPVMLLYRLTGTILSPLKMLSGSVYVVTYLLPTVSFCGVSLPSWYLGVLLMFCLYLFQLLMSGSSRLLTHRRVRPSLRLHGRDSEVTVLPSVRRRILTRLQNSSLIQSLSILAGSIRVLTRLKYTLDLLLLLLRTYFMICVIGIQAILSS